MSFKPANFPIAKSISIAASACVISISLPTAAAYAQPFDSTNSVSLASPSLPSLSGISGGSGTPGNGIALPSLPILGGLGQATGTQGERSLEVTPTEALKNGDKVSIKGSGYAPGASIYLTQTIEQPSGTYPSNYGESAKVTVGDDGSFTSELPVSTSFNDVDCTQTQCYIASFTAFPNLADRSNDVWVPIKFAEGQSGKPAESSLSSTSGASVALSKSENLNPSGDTVRVSGRGFKTSGQGIYVGIAQQNQMNYSDADSFGPGTVYVSTSRGNLNSDGSFSVDLPVSAQFGNANCLQNSCAIYTIAAHGSSDRSQDTVSPVAFSGGVAKAAAAPVSGSGGGSAAGQPQAQSGASSSATTSRAGSSGSASSSSAAGSSNSSNSTVSVSLSTTQLSAEGTTPITVSGSGFKTTGNGIYVAVAEKSKFSTTNADAFSVASYVRPSDMSSDGSFTTTLDVDPATSVANCLENECALYTFAAHGSSDRSQDTVTDLTIAGGETAAKEAAAKAAKDGKLTANSSKTQNKGTGSRTASSSASAEAAPGDAQLLASAESQMHPVFAGSIGAVIGAMILGAGLAIGRRTAKNKES